jgi:5'(3')-deoxyribonucleotidase
MLNELYDTSFRREQVTEFDFTKALSMSPPAAAAAKRAIGAASGFARHLDVYPGAIDGVRRLQQIAEVYIVTSPWNSNPTWCHDREAWLERHFGIPHARVIHTSAKHLIAGDVLVDDKTSTCDQWRAAWPSGVAVLWSTLHNRRDLWDGPCTSDWDHLIEIVGTVRT